MEVLVFEFLFILFLIKIDTIFGKKICKIHLIKLFYFNDNKTIFKLFEKIIILFYFFQYIFF